MPLRQARLQPLLERRPFPPRFRRASDRPSTPAPRDPWTPSPPGSPTPPEEPGKDHAGSFPKGVAVVQYVRFSKGKDLGGFRCGQGHGGSLSPLRFPRVITVRAETSRFSKLPTPSASPSARRVLPWHRAIHQGSFSVRRRTWMRYPVTSSGFFLASRGSCQTISRVLFGAGGELRRSQGTPASRACSRTNTPNRSAPCPPRRDSAPRRRTPLRRSPCPAECPAERRVSRPHPQKNLTSGSGGGVEPLCGKGEDQAWLRKFWRIETEKLDAPGFHHGVGDLCTACRRKARRGPQVLSKRECRTSFRRGCATACRPAPPRARRQRSFPGRGDFPGAPGEGRHRRGFPGPCTGSEIFDESPPKVPGCFAH